MTLMLLFTHQTEAFNFWNSGLFAICGTWTSDQPERLGAVELPTVWGGEEAVDVLQAQVLQVSEHAAQVSARVRMHTDEDNDRIFYHSLASEGKILWIWRKKTRFS